MSANATFMEKSSICHGCLSSDRTLQPLGKYSALYGQLLRDSEFYECSGTLLCWECMALLRKTQKFHNNIVSAQYKLQQWFLSQDINNPLSTLSSLTEVQNTINYDFVHDELQTNVKTQVAPVPDHIIKEENLNINNIKEEYDDFEFDNDFEISFDVDVKKERDVKPRKVRKKDKSHPSAFNYRKLSKIIQFDLDIDNLEQYYVKDVMDTKTWDESCKTDKKSSKRQYWCEKCNYGFRKIVHWQRHEDYLHTEGAGPHKCSYCGTKCMTKQLLSEHWKVHNHMFRCTLCSKHFYLAEWSIRNHLTESHRKQYVCRSCGKALSTCTEFKAHYKELHKQYICDICGVKRHMKSMLERHMRMKHLPHICRICSFKYSSHLTYTNHMRMYHPERILKTQVNLELAYCVECNRQFPSVSAYKRHLNESVVHKPRVRKETVPCPECGKIFARKVYMKNHFNFYHVQKTKHYCGLCDKYFCNGYGLRKHKQKVHDKVPDPKNKICEMCGRGFASNRILINHRRTHTGERPHACPHCSAAFAQKTALVSHMRTQHKHVL